MKHSRKARRLFHKSKPFRIGDAEVPLHKYADPPTPILILDRANPRMTFVTYDNGRTWTMVAPNR